MTQQYKVETVAVQEIKLLSGLMKIIEFYKAHEMAFFCFLLLFFLQNGKNFLSSHKEGGRL
jgi:hypothetical protein